LPCFPFVSAGGGTFVSDRSRCSPKTMSATASKSALAMPLGLFESLMRKKPIEDLIGGKTSLKRCLGLTDVVAFGVGKCLGAGLFVTIGIAAKQSAGPAVVLSFAMAGFVALLTALCFAEIAAHPKLGQVTGSAYMYAYATLGELAAFTNGWLLCVDCIVGGASIARCWSYYTEGLLLIAGWPVVASAFAERPLLLPFGIECVLSPMAPVLVVLLTVVAAAGTQESSTFNVVMACINLGIIAIFIFGGAEEVSSSNYRPFMPFGVTGVVQGAAIVYYAFLGFEGITAMAEETKDPSRTIPLGVVLTIVLLIIVYMCIAAVLVGMVPLSDIDDSAPLAKAFDDRGSSLLAVLVSMGAMNCCMANTLCSVIALPRVLYRMAGDGLLPTWFKEVSPTTKVPVIGVVVTGVVMALFTGMSDFTALLTVTSMASLLVYNFVCVAKLLLRDPSALKPVGIYTTASFAFTAALWYFSWHYWVVGMSATLTAVVKIWVRPAQHEQNLIPFGPLIPLAAILVNNMMIVSLGPEAMIHTAIAILAGLTIYIFYGRKHSSLNGSLAATEETLATRSTNA